jgi:hypothetical protein
VENRVVELRDECSHRFPSTGSRWWGEAWGFEFATLDGTIGGFLRLVVYPRQQKVWFWAAIVGENRKYTLCRDHDLAPPADPNVLEVRGISLWSHAICETPLEHWTVAMEAYAVEFDDPYEAWRDERGDRIGLAFDLEWESSRSDSSWVASDANVHRYDTPCVVNGTLQLGEEEWTIVGDGWRHHEWGELDWSGPFARGTRRIISSPADASIETIGVAPVLVDQPTGSQLRLLRKLQRTNTNGQFRTEWSDCIE